MNLQDKIIEKIKILKEKRNAVILAHNYQLPEVQDIADFVGDSLELSRKAQKVKCEVIVFCGVHFMAETAKILSPEKIVLLPDINAGCPMADMIDEDDLIKLKLQYPSSVVVAYVNTTAKVKTLTDICCTSANAEKVVNSLKDKEIIFIPDKYLGSYVQNKTGKKMYLYPGYCPTHIKILKEDIEKKRKCYPRAKVVVHPECTPEVISVADEVKSTSGICKFAREDKEEEFIIGTEIGILHRLKKENPHKKFYPATDLAICPNMKMINLQKILEALEEMKHEINIDEDIIHKAKMPIERMVEIT